MKGKHKERLTPYEMQFSLTYMINRKVHSEARSERDCSRALLFKKQGHLY